MAGTPGTSWFRRLYGARLLHLILLLAALALTTYTIAVVGVKNLFTGGVWWQSIVVWFAVAIIAHDLILFPLYALADRILTVRGGRIGDVAGRADTPSGRVPLTNYVRMPTLAAGLLLVMFFPGIISQGATTFTAATGLDQTPYLTRWLLLTAAFYLISLLCYGATMILRHRHSPSRKGAGASPAAER